MELNSYPMLLIKEIKTVIHAIVFSRSTLNVLSSTEQNGGAKGSMNASNSNNVNVTDENPYANNLCYCLEKIFNHGLKKEVSSYWKFLKNIESCLPGTKELVASIHNSYRNATPATRGSARGRLFVRTSLNESAISDYLAALLFHPTIVNEHYDRYAFLRTEESISILLLLLDTLKSVNFVLNVNSEVLKLDDAHYWYRLRQKGLLLSDEMLADFRKNKHPAPASPTTVAVESKQVPVSPTAVKPPAVLSSSKLSGSAISTSPKPKGGLSKSLPSEAVLQAIPIKEAEKNIIPKSKSPPRESGFFSFFSSSKPSKQNSEPVVDRQGFVKFTQQIKGMIRNGLPSRVRGSCWVTFARSSPQPSYMPSPEEFRLLANQEVPYSQKIIQDVDRTFKSSVTSFDSEKRTKLFSVLKAYCLTHPETGYVQGMSYIAGVLIHVTNQETEVFSLLSFLLNKFSIFSEDMISLRRGVYQLDRLIEQCLPKLFSHFKEQGVTPLFFSSEWFSTLFAYRVPLDACCRIWDLLFVEDAYYFFKIAIGILTLTEDALLKLRFESIIKFLKEEVQHIKVDNIIDAADKAPLTIEDVERLDNEFMNPNTDQYSCFANS